MFNIIKITGLTIIFLLGYGLYWGTFNSSNTGIKVVTLAEGAFLWKQGKTLFIDTREPEEYNEAHIPGSINITLRDFSKGLSKAQLSLLKTKDNIMPYCVKNFRGIEVAYALSKIGFTNIIITKPSGFYGWKKAKYPITEGAKK